MALENVLSCLKASILPSLFMEEGELYYSVENGGSKTLGFLAKKLQLYNYKPPYVNEEPADNGAETISISEKKSVAGAAIMDDLSCHSVKLCREKRAAVLVCLFEGDEGEVRVILTKRSMKLSSHPGNMLTELFKQLID